MTDRIKHMVTGSRVIQRVIEKDKMRRAIANSRERNREAFVAAFNRSGGNIVITDRSAIIAAWEQVFIALRDFSCYQIIKNNYRDDEYSDQPNEHFLDECRLRNALSDLKNIHEISELVEEALKEINSWKFRTRRIIRIGERKKWTDAGKAELYAKVYNESIKKIYSSACKFGETIGREPYDLLRYHEIHFKEISMIWGEYDYDEEDAHEFESIFVTWRTSSAVFIVAFAWAMIKTFIVEFGDLESLDYSTILTRLAIFTGIFFIILWITSAAIVSIASKYIFSGWRRYKQLGNRTVIIIFVLIPIVSLIMYLANSPALLY